MLRLNRTTAGVLVDIVQPLSPTMVTLAPGGFELICTFRFPPSTMEAQPEQMMRVNTIKAFSRNTFFIVG